MKKKIVAMMLVGVMVLMNNVVAFGAVGINGNTDTAHELGDVSKRDVMVKNTNTRTVYSIEIKWGDM